MRRKHKITALLLSLCMVLAMLPAGGLTAVYAAGESGEIPYLTYDNNTGSMVTAACSEYTLLTEDYLSQNSYTLKPGWYVADSDITVPSRIIISGDIHLILTDGSQLIVNGGVQCGEGNNLTIYGQEESTGELTAQSISGRNAGIGGGEQEAAGTITINGGVITTNGGDKSAAIGGGGGYQVQTNPGGIWTPPTYTDYPGGAGGEITINGGTVTAHGPSGAAGIGGGWKASSGVIMINGGTVVASSASYAAGIGGGQDGSGESITITGGNITANAAASAGEPAGIGAGGYGAAGTISITGGIVSATGCGKGIGSGAYNAEGTISISGGVVTANGIGTGNYGESIETSITGNSVVISTESVNTANQSSWHGLVIENSVGKVYGDAVTITEDCTLPGDVQLTIETDQTVTVPEDVTLTLESGCTLALGSNSSIVNHGTVLDKGAVITVAGAAHNHNESSAYVYRESGLSGRHYKGVICPDCPIANTDDILYIAEEACSGGTATCVKQAECQYCGQAYGELDPANHTGGFDADGFCKSCGGYQPAAYDSESGYYEISNAGQLFWFAGLVNGNLEDGTKQNTSVNGKLTADIDLTGCDWFPIGQYSDNSNAIPAENHYKSSEYKGTFDGNFHVISNLSVSLEYPYEGGLFGRISGGTVKNLGIENASIVSTAALSDGPGVRVGVIAGENTTGIIENCYTAGTITLQNADGGQRGGIAGETASGTIRNSFTTYDMLTAAGHSETIVSSYAASDLSGGQLASGELAWLLNGKAQGGSPWRQTIGTDTYPNFRDGSALVYASTCLGGGYAFHNSEEDAEAYHLKDTSPSHTQVIGDTLTLSADVQNDSGKSTDQVVSYQWYQWQETNTLSPADIRPMGEWEKNDGVYTSTEYAYMLEATFTVSKDGQAVGFEYLLPQSNEIELEYSLWGDSYHSDYIIVRGTDTDGTWQPIVFEDLSAGEYRLTLSLFPRGGDSAVSIKLQTTYEDYVEIAGATEKTYTVPKAAETGIYDYAVEASFKDSSERLEIPVSVVGPVYYVTIPAQAAAGESFTVTADAELIAKTQELTVTLSGTDGEDNAFTLQSGEGAVLGYSLKNGNTVLAIGDPVLSVKNGVTDSSQITVQPDTPRYAGTYTGAITFTISVEEVAGQ